MKRIPLTKGKFAFVDDSDFEHLSQYNWFARKGSNTWYAGRKEENYGHSIEMHRQILGLKFGDGIIADHRDGNGLNNQRYNLRPCSAAESARNRGFTQKRTSSKFKGVVLESRVHLAKRWRAQISISEANFFLGRFYTEEAAALAYNEAAKLHFKEFAKLNVL